MATEMKHIKDETRIKQVSHNGWMKHVRLPAKGEWSAIKLDTEQVGLPNNYSQGTWIETKIAE